MKKFLAVSGAALLVAALAFPAFGRGPGWGGGPGGGWGGGPRYDCPNYYGAPQANLTDEQRNQLAELGKKYYDSTAQLRGQLWAKRGELQSLLSSPSPDPERAKALQKELSDLRAKMAQERLAYSLEERKINPDARFQSGHGRGQGRGMGRGPGGYGRSGGGYGRGACWN